MSRNRVFLADIEKLIEVIGRRCTGYGSVFFVGGTCAAYMGWRESTMDVDIAFDPEPPGLFAAVESIKHELNVSIEMASPAHFVPAMPGWRGRSIHITQAGRVDFHHYDFYTQALAKLERATNQDLRDVRAMVERGLVKPSFFLELFEAIRPEFLRYNCASAEVILHRAKLLFAVLNRW